MNILDAPVYYMAVNKNYELEEKLAIKGFYDVTWVETETHFPKAVGVARAQKKTLERALAEDKWPFIVLEEDVEFYKNPPHSINPPEEIDALYLGLSQWGIKNGRGGLHIAVTKANNGMHRVWNMLAAHAIMYFSKDYVNFLINGIDIFLTIPTNQDKMRAETMKYWKVYALTTPVLYQSGKYMPHTKFVLPGKTNRPLSFFYM